MVKQSLSPVSVVVVAGLGAGLRLGNRAGGESESYSDLEENRMDEERRVIGTHLNQMNSRGISCWSADESPPSAAKGGNLAAFIATTDLALDRSRAASHYSVN